MIYQYRALNNKGKESNGEVEASSVAQAKQNLRNMGLYVTSIKQSSAQPSLADNSGDNVSIVDRINRLAFSRVTSKERGLFVRQLGTLLKAGMELSTSLGDIAEQTENEHFRGIIWSLKERIQEGSSLSKAMSMYPKAFNDLFTYMVRAGESLGRQDDILLRLADLEEKGNKLKNKIRSAMMYPAFMVVMMVVVISVLMTKVVPEITKVFTKSQQTLPMPTKVVIFISEAMSNYWFIMIMGSLLTIYAIYRYINSPSGRDRWDYVKLHNSVTRVMYGKIITSRFTRNLGLLLQSRVDLLDSMNIVKKIVQNVHVERALAETGEDIVGGGSLAMSLKSKEIFPKMVIGMIAAGEASDKLADMLLKIAEIYEEEVESAISAFMALLEPLIIVIMAISVGFVVMSIILPITQMNQLIK